MIHQPLSHAEFVRLATVGVLIFIGAALALGLVALGYALHAGNVPPDPYHPGKVCTARYLGEIAYWAEAPDNRMVCQRMDRESMSQRRCVGLDVQR